MRALRTVRVCGVPTHPEPCLSPCLSSNPSAPFERLAEKTSRGALSESQHDELIRAVVEVCPARHRTGGCAQRCTLPVTTHVDPCEGAGLV